MDDSLKAENHADELVVVGSSAGGVGALGRGALRGVGVRLLRRGRAVGDAGGVRRARGGA